ncbi:MAG: heme ABC transporter ATP-binding protein [Anaerolineales bacterium]|jgi:iron complex transport system ATP-binding protein
MLQIQSLNVHYGDHQILYNLELAVQPGEILAVVGPNGAGKSTLIKAASGVLNPSAGLVSVNGQNLATLSDMQRARLLAVVPQNNQLPGTFSVYQTVLLGRTPYLNWLGHTGPTDHAMTQLALEQTQISSFANRLVGDLSGGEKQRVLLARALAQDTPLLLLDEPTTYLDLQHQSSLLNLTRKLCQEKTLAVLIVLHDLNLASLYADRVALLVDGKLQAMGKPEQVLTSETLSAIYHVPVHVIPHPDYGTPLVLPDGRAPIRQRQVGE